MVHFPMINFIRVYLFVLLYKHLALLLIRIDWIVISNRLYVLFIIIMTRGNNNETKQEIDKNLFAFTRRIQFNHSNLKSKHVLYAAHAFFDVDAAFFHLIHCNHNC